MEDTEDTQIQQVQPSILNNIRRFITEWNQDLVSQTSGLVIVGTQVSISNGVNVIPLSLPIEESLVTYDDIPLFENIEILAPVTENPNQIDHPVDSEKDYFCQIRNDLLVRSNSTPFRQNPLTTQGWKNQANEIATLLNHEG
ncbi:27649_t:CDS:1, partial [Gigaspora margarita]